jgi:heme-degrading monooxygenase HmoA
MLPPAALISASTGDLLVSMRFTPDEPRVLIEQVRAAIEVLAQREGFIDARIGRAVDDESLVLVNIRWNSVGAYRRALSAYEVKVSVVPLLSSAVDEDTAFEIVHVRDQEQSSDFTGSRAADANRVGLGEASAGYVPPA